MDVETVNNTGLSTVGLTVAIIAGVVFWLVFVIAYIKIITKAGYSGWWILILLVPVANIVMLLVFAYKEWPIQRELAELRGWANQIQRGGAQSQQGYGQPGAAQPGYGQGYPQQ